MPDPAARVYAIGPFRLDVAERRLLRGDEVVPLLGKAFDTLLLLAEGAGTLQTQARLIDRLWPDVAVEPNSLQRTISFVRRALAGADDVRIETVRGRGYRLLADVREVSATPNERPGRGGRDLRSAEATDLPVQRTHLCTAHDGARLAYARLGSGPPLVKAAHWLSHLELDWSSPIWRHWLRSLGERHCLIRYDARGNGLSDAQPPSIEFADFVHDLGSVFDAAGIERAPVLGISQGAARTPHSARSLRVRSSRTERPNRRPGSTICSG